MEVNTFIYVVLQIKFGLESLTIRVWTSALVAVAQSGVMRRGTSCFRPRDACAVIPVVLIYPLVNVVRHIHKIEHDTVEKNTSR